VVGITGTNGKSTTTALVHHILQDAGVPARMGGNIGLPILAQDPLPEGGVYVLELSSYQIDLTFSLDCDVAALLNITPDHLDRYDGFRRLCRRQGAAVRDAAARQYAVIRTSDAETAFAIAEMAGRARGRKPLVRVKTADLARRGGQAAGPRCRGRTTCRTPPWPWPSAEALGLTDDADRRRPATFAACRTGWSAWRGQGVLFINDSKATNPASTAPALAAFPPIRPTTAPAHPLDRRRAAQGRRSRRMRAVFRQCRRRLYHRRGRAAFAELLEPHMPVERCEMMCEAVRRGDGRGAPGDVVLLRPACASFDQFRDYEARGDTFRQIVQALTGRSGLRRARLMASNRPVSSRLYGAARCSSGPICRALSRSRRRRQLRSGGARSTGCCWG
jgi:UDP-N-acetylmuramoylalanine--D-glutamate ligase